MLCLVVRLLAGVLCLVSMVPEPISISELTGQVKDLVEGNLGWVCVQGEISNFTRASSGHLYLTLKDDAAQIRAVMWRGQASRVKFQPGDGLQVVAMGAVEVYAPRGTYQLVLEELLPLGIGPLEFAFRQMHDKLAAEGLFAPQRKRPLPQFPRGIALVTSPTGAAVRDMLQVLNRRWPGCRVVIVPVPVQGAEAASAIAAALTTVHQITEVDVVITGRGGGSLEDLWAFNEEVVARAISNCLLPVISAVGHEIDVTIADLVADRRALTPSEAAELAIPNVLEVRHLLERCAARMKGSLRFLAERVRNRLDHLADRRAFTRPFQMIRDRETALDERDRRLQTGMRVLLDRASGRLAASAAQFQALNPLAVLSRGFSVTRRFGDTLPLMSSQALAPGDRLRTTLAEGEIFSEVTAINANPRSSSP